MPHSTQSPPLEVSIRRARPSDSEAIGEIRVRAWQAAYPTFMPSAYLSALDPGANLDGLRKLISDDVPLPLVTVAELHGITCGFTLLGAPRMPRDGTTHELWALNVSPAHWRAGIATKLVERALSDANSSGAVEVELWCISGNIPAESLYRRCGFRRTGETRTTNHHTGIPLKETRFILPA